MTASDTPYYFDANALVKYYQEQKGCLNIRRLVANSPQPIMVSPLTIVEYVGVLTRYLRQHHLKRTQLNSIVSRLRHDVGIATKTRPFMVTPMPPNVYQVAESLLLRYAHQAIGSKDGLHLAVVVKLNCIANENYTFRAGYGFAIRSPY